MEVLDYERPAVDTVATARRYGDAGRDAVPPPSRVTPETPCVHCGLPVGPQPVQSEPAGPAFCCTGCETVYHALQQAGFDTAYYRLRDIAPARGSARPARTKADDLQKGELDTAAFLAQHTRPAAEGHRQTDLFLDGVHCAACVWLVERLPFEMEGVTEARLDLPRARLTLTFDPQTVPLSRVADWLARFGYIARPARQDGLAQRTTAERQLLFRMGVAWALAGNVMLLAFALYSGLDRAIVEADRSLALGARWASLALAIPSLLYGAAPFFQRAWASIGLAWRARDLRRLHLDTPIALGIAVGFAHSAWATVTSQGDVWFDSITVLIAALLTARWLQLRSRRLAGDATERLLALIPSMVRKVREDEVQGARYEGRGEDQEGKARATSYELRGDGASADVSHLDPRISTLASQPSTLDPGASAIEIVRLVDLVRGDLVEVPAGEVIPVDGVVVQGASQVNNAVLTGESRPEPLAPGVRVEAGATNLVAPIRVRVEAVGEATRVGRLLAWVRDQEGKRAPVLLLANQLSGYFAIAVLALAVVTAAVWLWLAPAQAVPHVVALLVITCPCALGMATPLAMAVAAGRAARVGIFIKSDEATQRLTEVDTVVLDKTGTLTNGEMVVADTTCADGYDAAQVVRLAAALEAQSNHPIALAVVRAADERALPTVARFEAVAGQGVQGEVDGLPVRLGRPAWVVEAPLPDALRAAVTRYAEQGHTPVAVAVGGVAVAVLAVGDTLRDDAAAVVARLHAQGKTLYICSGDHPTVVQGVARDLAIPTERAQGGVTPEGKQAFVERLKADGAVVLMVGDGVNDAAALQAADVGVAVGGGSTASLVAADVFLTRPGLQPVAEALAGATHALHVVRRNLGVSLLYNVAGAAAAMLGFVTPLVAAVAMPVSSLVVVTSSILQRSFRQAR